MIIFKGLSEGKQHIYYQNISNKTIPVRIKIYESYTNGFIFHSDIDMEPDVVYYTFTHPPWSDRKVMIHHRETDELIPLLLWKVQSPFPKLTSLVILKIYSN